MSDLTALERAQLDTIQRLEAERDRLAAALREMERERDQARGNARILAHAYRHDSRPPDATVRESLDYPAIPAALKGAD